MPQSLAIVIPAYKTKYLDAALASIASQTNKNFKVYVSDDGSKEDIKLITDKYSGQINLHFHRFPDNAGKHDLVKHWNRSVELANEEWIWLFSDDDIMAPGCTQAFFDALHLTKAAHNVYRFNIEMIDAGGQVICVKEPHPNTETGFEFLQRRLQSKSLSAGVEYIFKREVFEQNKGFVNFPLAFCSDDASWITFSQGGDIYTVDKEKVFWRSSNVNISSVKGLHHQKIKAMLEYSVWLKNKFKELPVSALEKWFFENLKYVYGTLTVVEKFKLAKELSWIFYKSRLYYFQKLLLSGTI